MFGGLHTSLERLLYERGQIDPSEVDVRFEAPTKEWTASLLMPTINLFLFRVEENTDLRRTDFTTTKGNGTATRRMPARRIDLHYMVSVLSTSVVDEHELLWRTLRTLMKHAEIPVEILTDSLRMADVPISTRVAQSEDETKLLDVWSGLEAVPRPALTYVVTVPVDVEINIEAPLVLTRQARYTRFMGDDTEPRTRFHIGGIIRDKDGAPVSGAHVTIEGSGVEASVSDSEGRFVLVGVPTGNVRLKVVSSGKAPKAVPVTVPSSSYDVVLD